MQRGQSEEKLHRLLADRELMTVDAPADGIVYYGKLSRGKPGDAAAMADVLRPHGAIPPNQVVMTVVEPRPMCIRTTVPESHLHDLRPGLQGTAVPTGYPDLELSGDHRHRERHSDFAGQFRRAADGRSGGEDEAAHARHDLQGEAGPLPQDRRDLRAAEGR